MTADLFIQTKRYEGSTVRVLAFTLVELLVVVAIIAIVAAIAIPKIIDAIPVRAAKLTGPDSLKSGVQGTYTYTLGEYSKGDMTNGVVNAGAVPTAPEQGTSTVFSLTFDPLVLSAEIISVTYVSGGSVTGDSATDAGRVMVADPPTTSSGLATSGASKSGASGVTTVIVRADGDGTLTLVGTSDTVSATKVIKITP
jgi:prepilin-type N-terminal cleavage/methylation domain-containing protein